MLIHLIPKFLCLEPQFKIDIVDVAIPEIGLLLRGGKDIVARRPYPNKCYLVACKKVGQKAMMGLLIETPHHLNSYTSVSRWAIDAEMIVTHQVEHVVLDEEHDAVTDEMVLWNAHRTLGNRRPDGLYRGAPPVDVQPRMDLIDPSRYRGLVRTGADYKDDLAPDGRVLNRMERFQHPTIESCRLAEGPGTFAARVPPREHIFRA